MDGFNRRCVRLLISTDSFKYSIFRKYVAYNGGGVARLSEHIHWGFVLYINLGGTSKALSIKYVLDLILVLAPGGADSTKSLLELLNDYSIELSSLSDMYISGMLIPAGSGAFSFMGSGRFT